MLTTVCGADDSGASSVGGGPDSGHQDRTYVASSCRDTDIEADPGEAADRYRAAVEERRVVVESSEAGTAHLLATTFPYTTSGAPP